MFNKKQIAWFVTEYVYYGPIRLSLEEKCCFSLFLKTVRVLEFLIDKGISFQMETPEKYKLVLQMSSRALGRKKFNDLYLLFDLQNNEEINAGVLL